MSVPKLNSLPTPLFSCRDATCATESSYPEDEFRIHNGQLVCDACYMYEQGENEPDWVDLPKFNYLEQLQGAIKGPLNSGDEK